MTRILYDSTNPFDIPVTAELVAGYVDGIYGPNHATYGETGWDAAGWARFPNALHIGIAISASTNAGKVLDVETGDATPAQTPSWGRMRQRAGLAAPTFYVNRSNRSAVEDALHAAGFGPVEACLWVSTLDNTQTVAPSPYGYPVVAVQFAGSNLSGGHYDLSTVANYWPGVDPYNPTATAVSEVIPGGFSMDTAKQIDDLHAALIGNDGVIPNYRGWSGDVTAALGAVSAKLAGIGAAGLSAAQAQELTEARAILGRLEAALQKA